MQTSEINILIFWVCIAIGVVVYGVIIWSLLVYRKSRKREGDSFHKHTAIEIAWTVLPLLIIIAMIIPAAKLLSHLYGGNEAETLGLLLEPRDNKHNIVLLGAIEESRHFTS